MGVISDKARVLERFGQERCDICGEPFKLSDDGNVAEMAAPHDEELHVIEMTESKICHYDPCGRSKGLEIA